MPVCVHVHVSVSFVRMGVFQQDRIFINLGIIDYWLVTFIALYVCMSARERERESAGQDCLINVLFL